jgi:hypothetical protein
MPVVSRASGQHVYRPQVIPRGCVANAAIVLLWIVALGLLVVSTFGNYVLFVGGWETTRWPADQASYTALGIALGFQAICCLAQWGFKAIKLWFAYSVALLISVIPSFLAYNAVIGPWLAPQIGAVLAPLAIFAAAVFVDMLPEWIFVT